MVKLQLEIDFTEALATSNLASKAALTPEQIEELYAYDPDEPWWCR
jgi:hypothetical protein